MHTKIAEVLEQLARQNNEQGNKILALEVACSVMMAHVALSSSEGRSVLDDIQCHLNGVSLGIADHSAAGVKNLENASRIIASSIDKMSRHAEEAYILASSIRQSVLAAA